MIWPISLLTMKKLSEFHFKASIRKYIFAKIDVKVVNFQKMSLAEGRSLLICSNVMLQKDFQFDPHVF